MSFASNSSSIRDSIASRMSENTDAYMEAASTEITLRRSSQLPNDNDRERENSENSMNEDEGDNDEALRLSSPSCGVIVEDSGDFDDVLLLATDGQQRVDAVDDSEAPHSQPLSPPVGRGALSGSTRADEHPAPVPLSDQESDAGNIANSDPVCDVPSDSTPTDSKAGGDPDHGDHGGVAERALGQDMTDDGMDRPKSLRRSSVKNIVVGQDSQPPPLSMSTTAEKKVLHVLASNGVIERIPGRKGSIVESASDLKIHKPHRRFQSESLPPTFQKHHRRSATSASLNIPRSPRNPTSEQTRNNRPSSPSSSPLRSSLGQKARGGISSSWRLLSGDVPSAPPISPGRREGEPDDDRAVAPSSWKSAQPTNSSFSMAYRLVQGDVHDDIDDVESKSAEARRASDYGEVSDNDNNEDYDEDESDVHSVLMYEIFKKFCTPAPTLEQVEEMLERCGGGEDGCTQKEKPSRQTGNGEIRRRRSRSIDCADSSASAKHQQPAQPRKQGYARSQSIDVCLNDAGGSEDGRRPSLPRWTSENVGKSWSGGENRVARCPLPKDVVIAMGEGGTSVARLLWRDPCKVLLQLPKHFQLAFFRILIRLLANEDDDEYDEYFRDFAMEEELDDGCSSVDTFDDEIRLQDQVDQTSDLLHGWGDDENPSTPGSSGVPDIRIDDKEEIPDTTRFPRSNHSNMRPGWPGENDTTSSERHSMRTKTLATLTSQRRSIAGKANRLHSVVRFRCGAEWNRYCEKSETRSSAGNGAVAALLELFWILTLDYSTDENNAVTYRHHHLLPPVARLLGLLCTAGVAVRELRHILYIITLQHDENETVRKPVITTAARLCLIRALSYAAEGAANSTRQVSKASPRCFFTFGSGNGLSLPPATPAWPWPFKNEYGFALWFRAEHFDPLPSSPRPILFSMKTEDGAGIEVALDVFSAEDSRQSSGVSTLVVNVSENEHCSTVAKLQGCVLSPKIWYHIAVRHTCPGFKGIFTSARDEVSVLVDGKVMLTQELKFPKSLATYRGGKSHARLTSFQFGKNFEGQTGALYVFKEYVSDATIKALYEHTAGTTHTRNLDSPDLVWDSHRGELARLANTVPQNMPQDTEDLALPNLSSMHVGSQGVVDSSSDASVLDLDMGEGTSSEHMGLRPELSRALFASKVCLVWDPCRSSGQAALEAHLGAHAHMDPNEVQSWVIHSAKAVIGSIGGVQSLLPLFRLLLVEEKHKFRTEEGDSRPGLTDEAQTRCDADEMSSGLIPSLICLLASFVRNNEENSREILRCGGVEIVEQCFLESKLLSAMAYVRKSPRMAKLVVDGLLDLRLATSHNLALESKVFSRLLFNIPLWLGGLSEESGVALHIALLPVLASIAKSSPNKVRDCIDVRDLLQYINEVTRVAETTTTPAAMTNRFNWPGAPCDTPLTPTERRHVVDVVLDIIATITAPKTTVAQLNPLLNFISFNLDMEWEKASQLKTPTSAAPNNDKYVATSKACMLLLFLLQSRPLIPSLYDSFMQCCGNADGVASWILCCMVNSFDDFIRSLGVRCLTAYLDGVANASSNKLSGDDQSVATVDTHLETTTSTAPGPSKMLKSASTLHRAAKYVGTGLGVLGSASPAALGEWKVNVKVVYKLLWHLLKCHRERLGDLSHSALVHLLVDDGTLREYAGRSSGDSVVATPSEFSPDRAKAKKTWASVSMTQVGIDTSQSLRNFFAVGTILRLLRFLPPTMIERWLFDLLALTRVSPNSIKEVLPSNDWQPCLFHLISEIVEELSRERPLDEKTASSGEDEHKNEEVHEAERLVASGIYDIEGDTGTAPTTSAEVGSDASFASADEMENRPTSEQVGAADEKSAGNADKALHEDDAGDNVVKREQSLSEALEEGSSRAGNRFDLALKLYSCLLGQCVREGGDKSYQAVEQTASLQRVCVNGHEVFCIVLSHLLNELTDSGTVANIGAMSSAPSIERNRALKQSARVVTNAILLNGTNDMDLATAVKHWRCLRHLTAVTVAVVTNSGFGVSELFDYRNHDASAIESISGGLHGIRLPDGTMSGLGASQVLVSATQYISDSSVEDEIRMRQLQGYRMLCVTLSSQLLSLLDAFIFPDSLDTSLPASQLHGLALVRSTEPRLGQAQGPLLASLLRLSLLLLSHLEPSSVKFLQCCGRLRCFLHWTLELIRESVALGGYSAAFQELTAPLDRLVLAVVLQCHRALGKCSHVLMELDSTPPEKYFESVDSRQKNYRRLFRATFELREIVLAAYRGRNEVLRAALSLQAYEALQAGLEEITAPKRQHEASKGGISGKEAGLRAFLANSWVRGFHDVEMQDDLAIPEQVANGQVYRKMTSSDRGRKAIEELAIESAAIVDEYNRALDKPFENYCEDQRQWAETEAVRDLEYEGDLAVKRLAEGQKGNRTEMKRLASLRADLAADRWKAVDDLISWSSWGDGCDPGQVFDGVRGGHWKMAERPDRLQRRILLEPNRRYDSHEDASYEGMLGREREKAIKEEEERQKLSDSIVKKASNAFYTVQSDAEELDDGMVEFPQENALRGIRELEEESGDGLLDDGETVGHHTEHSEDIGSDWDEIATVSQVDINGKDDIAWARSFIWAEREQVVQRFNSVILVSLRTQIEGELLLTTHSIYFHPTGDEVNVMLKHLVTTEDESKEDSNAPNHRKDRRWRLGRLVEAHGRRYMLKAQAIELFFADTHELFINFNEGPKTRDGFYAKLRSSCKVPLLRSPRYLAPRSVFKRSRLTELWRRRKITNFQYIMQLNLMAGRTFNDITQYPVFPWVISDYSSETLNLNDSRVFRDLSKPIGALNPDRLSHLIERYNHLDGFKEHEKFLYGSHYSSPGVVLYYLLRQEPYTSMAIDLQSGRFDCPDRLFYNVGGSWNSCLTLTSDVKELVPEFFTCPEIFINSNRFPLGETQDGTVVNDVVLPPWSNGSAHEFVRLNRLALESEYVSQNLNHWIDLIFGYKQRGPEAAKAHNVFHFLSYEGFDWNTITDEVERKATESHIQNFGQTPSQLILNEPHPSRYPAAECWQPLCSEVSRLRQLRCWTPSKQFGVSKSHGDVLGIHVLTDQIVAIYADLSVGTYKWSTKSSGRAPFFFRMDKLRTLGCRSVSMSPTAICGSALSDSVSSASARDRASTVAEQLEHEGDGGGKVGIGSWSFGMTVGGSLKDSLSRKSAISATRAIDTAINVDASFFLLSCGYWDDTIKMHTLDATLKLKCTACGGHRGPINCLSIGDDGGLMITGGHDATCRVWVVDHPDMAVALTGSYVQTKLGSFGEGGQDRLLSCCHVLWGHIAPISCLSFSSDLDVVVSGSLDGLVCVHRVREGKFVRSIRLDDPTEKRPGTRKSAAIRKLALDTTGVFVAHTYDGMLHMCTVNGNILCSVDAGDTLHAMEICSGGEMLVTGGENCYVVIRTLRDLGVRCVLDLSSHGPIRCISFTPAENNPSPQYMYIGTSDGMLTIVDADPLVEDDGTEDDGLPQFSIHDGREKGMRLW